MYYAINFNNEGELPVPDAINNNNKKAPKTVQAGKNSNL